MEQISLVHGGGGKQTNDLINKLFIKYFGNRILNEMGDAAQLTLQSNRIAFTTDSFVVKPLFFNGGDIGKLAVCGTINDLAVSGAKPMYISSAFIIEEGFSFDQLEKIVKSMAKEAERAGVKIVAGDTKVVERGSADGLFINTSGIGILYDEININASNARPGDIIIVNGTLGDHGTAILCERNNIGIQGNLISDCASLNEITDIIFKTCHQTHVVRDATRGGFAAVLNEIAEMSKVEITIAESALPISEEVRSVSELLGLDPLYIANEGKLCAFLPEKYGEIVLQAIKKHPLGKNAAIIGKITGNTVGKVYLKTIIGGRRIIDMPSGIQLPRIC